MNSQAFKELAKSGIVTLVVISVLGGYLVGQPMEQELSWSHLFLTLFGVMSLSSGASALNQIQERDIDARMPRTARRPLPSGRLSLQQAWAFVILTVILGCAILAYLSTALLVLGLVALISYNGLYTLWWKKNWAFAAIPGAVPGALPILMGYTAATHEVFSPGGLYLFFLLFFWQMPHFWVLALRYVEDYRSGGVPTLPVQVGATPTVIQISIWCLGYLSIALMAPLFLDVRAIYLSSAIIVSILILRSLRKFSLKPESQQWLKFFLWVNFSLILFVAAAALDRWSLYFWGKWWMP